MPAYAGLDVRSEVYLGTWTSVPLTGPGSIRNSSPIAITRGRQNLKSQMTPSQATFTVDNRDGRWTIRNPLGAWYGQLVQNTPIRFSVPSSLTGIPAYLRLETDDASYASAPDIGTPSTPVLVQSKQGTGTTTPLTITLSSPTTAGNCLVVAIGSENSVTYTVTGVTLGGSATGWASQKSVLNSGGSSPFAGADIWVCSNITGGQTAVAISTSVASGLEITVYEFSGMPATTTVDQTSAQTGTALGTFTSGSTPTTTQANEVWVAVASARNSAANPALTGPASPWINETAQTVGTLGGSISGYQITSSTGVATYAGTMTGSGTTDSAAAVITLKAATASGPFDITSGTLSVRVDCKITDWVSNHVLFAKYGATGSSWALWTNGDGRITLGTYDGTKGYANFSPIPLPYFGARIAIRADYNISAQTVTWYTAPTMSGSWTQLGTVNGSWGSAGVPSVLSAGTGQPVQVGAGTTNLAGMYGEVYEAQLWSTATLVADPVFTSQTIGATSFTDGQSNTWTLAGTSELSGRSYRFHGELAANVKSADPSQRNLYSTAQAGGIMRRLSQAQTPADSAMKRAYLRLPSNLNLAAYWSAEDMAGATQIGQSVGSHAMTAAGLTMASSSVFACSSAIPVMNGATATGMVDPASVSWTDNVIRFLLAIPAADDTNGAVVCQFTTQGTATTVQVVYGTGSVLTMSGYNAAGSQIFSHGITFANNPLVGRQVRVSIELLGSGNYNMWVLPPGGSATGGGSTWSGTIGGVTSVSFGGGLVTSAMGHFSVQGVSDGINDLSQPLYAWFGETAGARFTRLCGEEGINCRITGPPDKSQPMGFQTQQTIAQLLQEVENTDQGLMTETRQVLGFGYVTNWALCNQPATAVADYSQREVDPAFAPASDDTLVVNDVTMTAADGSIARQVLATGTMSVASPPSGVGRFDTSVQVNPEWDAALANLAGWYLHVRTADEDRYPSIPFRLARGNIPQAVGVLDIGNYLQIINTPSWLPPDPIKQIIVGVSESLGPQPNWDIALNGIPEAPYEVATADDLILGHADTSGSEVHANASYGAATIQVDTITGPLWTTNSADYPFDLISDGMTITASGCSGASSPQTMTISVWGVNGVQKNLTAGHDIRLAHPMIAAL